ncbi:MAG: esterase family protein [Planctomycetia bacterium]|nr:esterase family protein [Planctomycetia bacterium]
MPLPPRDHWSTIAVAGHPCEIHAPPDALPDRALIFLHGLRERSLQETPALRDVIETHRLPVLAPRTGRSWWLDRIVPAFDEAVTPERYVVDTIRGDVARRFGVEPPGIALVGTGMGGQGALRLAYRHPAVFPVAGAIAPAIDFHQAMRDAADRDNGEDYDTLWQLYGDVERARQDTAILHVHPLNWPRHQCFVSDPDDIHWHDGAVRLHGKLVALGIPHLALLEARGGADFEARAAADVMRFVLEALDKESRRVPS